MFRSVSWHSKIQIPHWTPFCYMLMNKHKKCKATIYAAEDILQMYTEFVNEGSTDRRTQLLLPHHGHLIHVYMIYGGWEHASLVAFKRPYQWCYLIHTKKAEGLNCFYICQWFLTNYCPKLLKRLMSSETYFLHQEMLLWNLAYMDSDFHKCTIV